MSEDSCSCVSHCGVSHCGSAGWRYIDTDPLGTSEMEPPHLRVGYASGPIVGQAVPMASHDDVSFERVFCILGCFPGDNTAMLTIRRTPGTLHFVKGVTLSLTMDTKEQVRPTPLHMFTTGSPKKQNNIIVPVILVRFMTVVLIMVRSHVIVV